MDYIEADVLSHRPRICRMFSPAVKSEDAGRLLWSRGSSAEIPGAGARARSVSPNDLEQAMSGRGERAAAPLRYVRIPALRPLQVSRNGHYGLEDSGQGAWFHDGLMYGQNNLAFSFDEDLGRTHLRRVMRQGPPVPTLLPPPAGREMARHGYTPHMDVIDSESHNTSNSDNTSTVSLGPHDARPPSNEGREAVVEAGLSSKTIPPQDLRISPVDGQRSSSTAGDLSSRTCSHCGSELPPFVDGQTAVARTKGPAPKRRHKYRRQTACSDSLEKTSRLSQSGALETAVARPSHLSSSPPSSTTTISIAQTPASGGISTDSTSIDQLMIMTTTESRSPPPPLRPSPSPPPPPPSRTPSLHSHHDSTRSESQSPSMLTAWPESGSTGTSVLSAGSTGRWSDCTLLGGGVGGGKAGHSRTVQGGQDGPRAGRVHHRDELCS